MRRRVRASSVAASPQFVITSPLSDRSFMPDSLDVDVSPDAGLPGGPVARPCSIGRAAGRDAGRPPPQ